MTTANSQVTVFPEKLYHLRVLLVESDQNSLKHHAYMLSRNSYRVTSTRKASIGLSLIINGSIFDCVVVEAENLGMNVVHFFHQISKHQPHLPIIVMAWSDFHVRIAKDSLVIERIWFLQKPCQAREICNFLQHVCSTRISFKEWQGFNNVHQFNTVVIPSSIRNTISISSDISSRIGIHRGLNIDSHKYCGMFKPVNYIDISSDDDELVTIKENAYTGRAKNIDKGKKPMELKRKNDQRVEDGVCCKNKIEIKTGIPWTTADNGKFMETSNALQRKNAYRKEIPILKQRKLQGYTLDHVTSHLQIFQERKNNIKKPSVVAPIQMGNNLPVASYACNRFGLSTPFDNNATITECNKSTRTSYMTLDGIKGKLQQASPSVSQQITTTLNCSSDNNGNSHNFNNLVQSSIGATEKSLFNLVEEANNSFDSGVSKTLAPFDSFGNKVEPLITTTGSVATSSNQGSLEDLFFTEFPSDLGSISPLQDFDKFEENVENLFDIEDSRNLSFSNSDSVTFGTACDDYSLHSTQGEENNSIVPFDGSEGRLIDDDWFLGMIHPE